MEEAASNGKHEEVKKEQEEVIIDDREYKKDEVENESSKEVVVDGIPVKVTESQENIEPSSSSSDSSDEETEPEKTKKDLPAMEDKILEPVIDVVKPGNPEEKELGENPEEGNAAEEDNEVEIFSTAADKVSPNGVAVIEKGVGESQEPEDPVSVVVEEAAVVAAVEEAAEAKVNEEKETVVQPKEESVDAGVSSETLVDLASKSTATAPEVKEYVETQQELPETATCTTADETSTRGTIPESTANPAILSVTHRTHQRTSWKSCCGLFEVLRRSDR